MSSDSLTTIILTNNKAPIGFLLKESKKYNY